MAPTENAPASMYRRNEGLGVWEHRESAAPQVLDTDGTLNDDIVKGELPAGLALGEPDQVALSKQAALRLRYNRNRGIEPKHG